jgi:hypothetical protein
MAQRWHMLIVWGPTAIRSPDENYALSLRDICKEMLDG